MRGKRTRKLLAAIVLPMFVLTAHPVALSWAKESFCLRPAGVLARDGGKKFTKLFAKSKRAAAVATMTVLLGSPLISQPLHASERNKDIAVATAGNALIGGMTALIKARKGERWRAFRYGAAGGAFSAATTLKLARLFREPGGPFVLRALNAYGANVVENADLEKPFRESLNYFQYPIGPGVLSFEKWKPRHYTLDIARTAATLSGLATADHIQGGDFFNTGGVFVFGYDESNFRKMVENAVGFEMFGSVALDEDYVTALWHPPSYRERVMGHEVYHVFQEDRLLLTLGSLRQSKWHRKWTFKWLSFKGDASYALATTGFNETLSSLKKDHDRRPHEWEANLFEEGAASHDGGFRTKMELSRRSLLLLEKSI